MTKATDNMDTSKYEANSTVPIVADTVLAAAGVLTLHKRQHSLFAVHKQKQQHTKLSIHRCRQVRSSQIKGKIVSRRHAHLVVALQCTSQMQKH